MIFIEGPRNTGKTYLLEHYLRDFPNSFMTHKFPFFEFYSALNLSSNSSEANAFSFGKDLALFALAKDNLLPHNLLLDRGFISSIVFSKIFRKEKEERLVEYANLIIESFKDVDIDIVYVTPDEVGRKRANVSAIRSKDETEIKSLTNEIILPLTYNIWYKWTLALFANCPNVRIHHFINRFDEASIEEFNSLLNSIKKTI